MNYIFDGNIHALNEKLAYIIEVLPNDLKPHEVKEKHIEMMQKYAHYLYENDKDSVIEWLMKIFESNISIGAPIERVTSIYRPASMNDALAQNATMAIKFTRAEKDNLN